MYCILKANECQCFTNIQFSETKVSVRLGDGFWMFLCFGFQHESKWHVFVKRNNIRSGNITLPHYRKTLVQLDQACHVCHSPIIKFWSSNNKGHWISRPQESPSSPVLLRIIVSQSGREALNLSSTHSERNRSRTSQDASRPCK